MLLSLSPTPAHLHSCRSLPQPLPRPQASRWLADGWLLLRLHDGSGPRALAALMRLRGGAARLLGVRLRAARLTALAGVQVRPSAARQLLLGFF
jgi:hypothetical protein